MAKTTRELLEEKLRKKESKPSDLADDFDTTPEDILEHIRHISRSLDDSDDEILVIPPECIECGFNDFDDLTNLPSRCPSCKNEGIEEPIFKIE